VIAELPIVFGTHDLFRGNSTELEFQTSYAMEGSYLSLPEFTQWLIKLVYSVLDGVYNGFDERARGSYGAEVAEVYGKEWEYGCFWGGSGKSD
jgi:hypothetical protein